MKKIIILSSLAFVTLSALGLNTYLKNARGSETEIIEESFKEDREDKVMIEEKIPEKKPELTKEKPQENEQLEKKVQLEEKQTIKVKAEPVPAVENKKQLERKFDENDMPPVEEVLESNTADTALAVADEKIISDEAEVPREVNLEHFSRASLKQPSETYIKKQEKISAKVSKNKKYKKRKLFKK